MITSPLSSLLSGAVGSGAAALINPAARSVVIDGSSYLYESPALLPTVIKALQSQGREFTITKMGVGGAGGFLQQLALVALPLLFMHNMISKLDPSKGESDGHLMRCLHREEGKQGGKPFDDVIKSYPKASMTSVKMIYDHITGRGTLGLKGLNNGVIFSGTPGNGKSHVYHMLTSGLARHYVEEGVGDVGVVAVQANGSEFIYKYVGVGANRIKAMYDSVRRKCVSEMKSGGFKEMIGIVCIDEIDSFTFQRASHHQDTTHNSEQHHTLNMFLSLLDEGDEDEDGDRIKIFTMATTNLLRGVDTAVKRYGRFDDISTLVDPSEEERRSILENESGRGGWGEIVDDMEGMTRVEVARVGRTGGRTEGDVLEEIRRIKIRRG